MRLVARWWFVGAFVVIGVGLLVAGLLLLRKPDPVRADALPSAVLTDTSSSVGVKVGDVAPLFELRDEDGSVVRLADFRGRPVLINFFATWCGPCQQETPAIQSAYEQLKDRGLVVISIDVQESSTKVASFVARYGITFHVGIDGTSAVARRYGVYGIPANYIVDKEGVVRFVDSTLTLALIEQRLASLW